MVKQEWNSTQLIDVNDLNILSVIKGDYDITLMDGDGNVVDEITSVQIKDNCQLNHADFEATLQSDLYSIVQATVQIESNGFTGQNALYVRNRSAEWAGVRIKSHGTHEERPLRFAAKMLAPEQALSYVAAVTVKRIDSDGNNQYVRIHTHPVVDPYNWFMVDFVYNAMVTDAEVYISFDNDYTGDYALDRIYDVVEDEWNSCRVTKVDFSGNHL